MKQIILLVCIAFVISGFFCASCQKHTPCHTPKNDTSFISSFYQSIIPYKINNYINFKHSSGQTWTYKVQSIDSGYDFAQDNSDCPNNYHLQYVKYNLWKSGTTSKQWDLDINLYYNFGYSNRVPLIAVNYKNDPYISLIDDYPTHPSPIYKYDSIYINSYKYFYVNLARMNQYNDKYYIFYNREFGILKIISPTDTLERIQ